jgi:hypothetical protein
VHQRNSEAGRFADKLYAKFTEFVSQHVKLLVSSTTLKDTKEIIESTIYATLGTMIISRVELEKKLPKFDLRHPAEILKVERIIADEVCKIAVDRLEAYDRGAKYRIVIVKVDRPLKNG